MAATDNFNNVAGTQLIVHNPLWVKSGMPTAPASAQTGVINAAGGVTLSDGSLGEWLIYYHNSTPPSADYSAYVTVMIHDAGDGTGIGIRISASSVHDSSSFGYILGQQLADGGSTFGIVKKTSGISGTTLVSMAHPFSNGALYRFHIAVAGASPTVITARVQRVSDGLWLTPAGGWQAGTIIALTATDSVAPFTAAGHSGISLWGAGTATGEANYLDDFSTEEAGGVSADSATVCALV